MQDLFLVFTPSPHVTVQGLNLDHSVYFPSTENKITDRLLLENVILKAYWTSLGRWLGVTEPPFTSELFFSFNSCWTAEILIVC